MGKALVIKGTNFSENKIETVEFTENVPCTGVTVSPVTITFTSIGSTQALSISKTPANTTDDVSITSSDESVCTVLNGVVTAVGMGTATITVTCGNVSDTCDVDFTSMEYAPDWSVGKSTYVETTGGTMYFVGDSASPYIFAAKDIASGNTAEVFYLNHKVDALVIPNGCDTILVTMDDYIGKYLEVSWFDSTSKPYTQYPTCLEGVSQERKITILQAGNELSVPSSADSFVLHVQTDETQTQFADMSSVASAANIKIYAVMGD